MMYFTFIQDGQADARADVGLNTSDQDQVERPLR